MILCVSLKKTYTKFSESYAKSTLQKYIKNNQIARIGRNKYIFLDNYDLSLYNYSFSEEACKINKFLNKQFPYLDFKIFELIQLNEFLNYQVAHNVIFIYVESDLSTFVFDVLKKSMLEKI